MSSPYADHSFLNDSCVPCPVGTSRPPTNLAVCHALRDHTRIPTHQQVNFELFATTQCIAPTKRSDAFRDFWMKREARRNQQRQAAQRLRTELEELIRNPDKGDTSAQMFIPLLIQLEGAAEVSAAGT